MNRVLVIACNNAYLDHARSLLVNCRRVGKWDGDFAILCAHDLEAGDLPSRGIEIVRTPEPTWGNAVKFYLFGPEFRRWDQVLYLDCDVLVQRPLPAACEELSRRFPAILMDGTQALPGGLGTTILQDWEHFGKLQGVGPEVKPDAYRRLRERFPRVDEPVFVSSVMLFDPGSIPDGTVERILDVAAEFLDINPRRYDQEVMCLVLYDRMESSGKNFVTWWAFDEPCNRVVSETRVWRGDEFPAIVHYWNMYAPWLVKAPDAGAYFNERLGRVCRELYLENLAAFKEEFPRG